MASLRLLQDDSDTDDSLLTFRPFKSKPLTASSQNHEDHPPVVRTAGVGENDTSSKSTGLLSQPKENSKTTEPTSPSSTNVAVEPQSDDEEAGDPQQLALQRLKNQNWNIPEAAKMITHPNQLQWLVRDPKKPNFVGRRTKKRKSKNDAATSKIKKLHVLPCRIANDQEIRLYNDDVGVKKGDVLVQHLGIHRRDKNLMESVGKGRLIRFDGTVQLPTQEDVMDLDEACLELQLSDDYLEGYRCTLKTMMKLSNVEQWMEAIMLKRILQSVQDNMAEKIRLQQESRVSTVADNADDIATAQKVESILQQRRANVVDDEYYSAHGNIDLTTTTSNKKKETLRVGDVIHYYPPELVAVDANLVCDVTVRGIDSNNPLCVVLDNGRGLGMDSRIRRVFRILRGKLVPIEHPYDCAIDEYRLVNGGDMAIAGFGSMKSEAKALVQAQRQVQAEMKKLGYGSMEGLFHNMDNSKPEGTKVTPKCRDPDKTATLPVAKNEIASCGENQKEGVEKPAKTISTETTDELTLNHSVAKESNLREKLPISKSESNIPAPLEEKDTISTNVSKKTADGRDGMLELVEGDCQQDPDLKSDESIPPESDSLFNSQTSTRMTTQSSEADTEPTPVSLQTIHHSTDARLSPTVAANDAIQKEPTTLTTVVVVANNTAGCDSMAHHTGPMVVSPEQASDTAIPQDGFVGVRSIPVCKSLNTNTGTTVQQPSTLVANVSERRTSPETTAPASVAKTTNQVSKQKATRCQSNETDNDRLLLVMAPKRVYRRQSSATGDQPAFLDNIRTNRRPNSEHLTKDQMELVDQVVAIMEQRWGKFPNGLHRLLNEAELDHTFELRVKTFLQKDKAKILRAAVHQETENNLRAWLQTQGGNAAAVPPTADDSSNSEQCPSKRAAKNSNSNNNNNNSSSSSITPNEAIRVQVLPQQHRSATPPPPPSNSSGKRRHAEIGSKTTLAPPPPPPSRKKDNKRQRLSSAKVEQPTKRPIRTSRQRQSMLSATHMTKEQQELADEVLGLIKDRCGGNDLSRGLLYLEQELGLEDYQDRLKKFLTKDPHKLIRQRAHEETERHLRTWLERQRGEHQQSQEEEDEEVDDEDLPDELSI